MSSVAVLSEIRYRNVYCLSVSERALLHARKGLTLGRGMIRNAMLATLANSQYVSGDVQIVLYRSSTSAVAISCR